MTKILLEETLHVIRDVYNSTHHQLNTNISSFDPVRALSSVAVDVYTNGYVFEDFVNPREFAYEHLQQFPIAYDLYLHLGGNPEAPDWEDFLYEHPYVFETLHDGLVYFDKFYEPVDRQKLSNESIAFLLERFYGYHNISILSRHKIITGVLDGHLMLDDDITPSGYDLSISFDGMEPLIKNVALSLENVADYALYIIKLYGKFQFAADELYAYLLLNQENFIYKKEEM